MFCTAGCFRALSDHEGVTPVNQTATLVKNGTWDSRGNVADKRQTGKWPGCFPMLLMEAATTVIFFGIISNLVTYMTAVLHQGVAKSARDVNNWQGTLFVSSVLGAFISDTYWGRYKTMSYAAILYFLGLTCLTISASVRNLRPPPCPPGSSTCAQPTEAQFGFFYFSLYLVAFSAGSITACLMSFGADQFDEADELERRQKHSFFNWLLWSIHIGGFISVTALVYVEDHVGWSWGFGILLIVMSIAMLVFFLQTRKYRYRQPEASPITKVAQVLVAAFKKRNTHLDVHKLYEKSPTKGSRLALHTNQFLFLSKAAVKLPDDQVTVVSCWKLSTVTRVEEVKMVIRMLPVWVTTLWFTTAPSQSATFFLRQGMAMNNQLGSFKVPQASMLVFSNLGVLLLIPLYNYILVPAMRKLTKNERGISLLQRIGVGIGISVVALVVAALVEIGRKNQQLRSIFWLVPQYLILGIAEGMANTGMLEFFHDQSPDTMHSMGISFALANLGVGAFLSSVLVTIVNRAAPSWLQNDVNKGHLEYFYWLLAGLSAINLIVYISIAWWYSYKGTASYLEVDEEL